MMPLVDVLQPCGIDMGVNLGRLNIGMTEEFLDDSQIRPAGNEVRSERVPQNVGMDFLEPRRRRLTLHNLPDRNPLQRSAILREKKAAGVARTIAADEVRSEIAFVLIDDLQGGLAEGDEALMPPLANHIDHAEMRMNAADVNVADLGGP